MTHKESAEARPRVARGAWGIAFLLTLLARASLALADGGSGERPGLRPAAWVVWGAATAMVVALTAVTVRRRADAGWLGWSAGAGSVFTAWHLIRS
ncbi:hypothetical protein [Actinacidiphila soli]|jgi:hypothetical protein|uniref:hypothetical protein n=1 Tax=Actinacidiphila soli TaxID=2487275 RepID=UPI000FCB6CCA|nr:hypothetical protein [Actinacidiphila soli]